MLVGGLFVQAMSVATYLAVGQLGEFYALSVIFGLAYGGVMPLYAVLVREYFGAHIMGTVFGAVSALPASAWRSVLGRRPRVRHLPRLHMAYAGSFAYRSCGRRSGAELSVPKRPSQPSLDLGRAAA